MVKKEEEEKRREEEEVLEKDARTLNLRKKTLKFNYMKGWVSRP